jgi:predicted O-methyltransferase YrrM
LKYPAGEDALPEHLNEYWADFFKMEGCRLMGQDCYEAIFESPLLFPLQRRNEMAEMMRTSRGTKPRVVFEIGADKGGGLYHWCKCLPVERVIACEIRGTPYAQLFQDAFPEIEFMWIQASSYDKNVVAAVDEWLGEDKIDCLFIDGDKNRFDLDFQNYLPMMKKGGIVFMHDIQDRDPRKAYDKVRQDYNNRTYVNVDESRKALERKAKEIEPANVHEEWLRYWAGRSAGIGVIHV